MEIMMKHYKGYFLGHEYCHDVIHKTFRQIEDKGCRHLNV